MQECILPRALFSMEDAVFCARFLERLAECQVPNFNFGLVMDHTCRDIIPVIRCCTDQEASTLIVFMKEVRHSPCNSDDTISMCCRRGVMRAII